MRCCSVRPRSISTSGIDVLAIEALHARARELAPRPAPTVHVRDEGRAVAILQYRDGRVTDIVRQVGR